MPDIGFLVMLSFTTIMLGAFLWLAVGGIMLSMAHIYVVPSTPAYIRLRVALNVSMHMPLAAINGMSPRGAWLLVHSGKVTEQELEGINEWMGSNNCPCRGCSAMRLNLLNNITDNGDGTYSL